MTSMRDILEDARKLSRRLRSHDVALDRLIGSAEDNLKRIQSLKQYQEAQDQLNSVGSSKLRTQIVLDLQKENHHIRELQQENMELRAALEDHQKATELIMSKYRQHLSHLVNSSKIDTSIVQAPLQGQNFQERDDKICEMASVMNYAIVIDEQNQTREREFVSKLVTENRGLRELLEISRCNGSLKDPLLRPKMVSRPSQTDVHLSAAVNGASNSHPHDEEEEDVSLSEDDEDDEDQNQLCSSTDSTASSSSITSILVSPINNMTGLSDEEDPQQRFRLTYSTIKKKKGARLVGSLLSNGEGGGGGSDGNASSSPDVEDNIHDGVVVNNAEEEEEDDDERTIISEASSNAASSANNGGNKFLERTAVLLSTTSSSDNGAGAVIQKN